jgi:hypothetical protein
VPGCWARMIVGVVPEGILEVSNSHTSLGVNYKYLMFNLPDKWSSLKSVVLGRSYPEEFLTLLKIIKFGRAYNKLPTKPNRIFNILSNNYNKEVFYFLKRHDMEPIITPFTHRYFWDGGLHCITLEINRSGTVKDYFPEKA